MFTVCLHTSHQLMGIMILLYISAIWTSESPTDKLLLNIMQKLEFSVKQLCSALYCEKRYYTKQTNSRVHISSVSLEHHFQPELQLNITGAERNTELKRPLLSERWLFDLHALILNSTAISISQAFTHSTIFNPFHIRLTSLLSVKTRV